MCMRGTCSSCNKISWWGCGKHIPALMDPIDQGEWCTCEPKLDIDGKKYPPKAANPVS